MKERFVHRRDRIAALLLAVVLVGCGNSSNEVKVDASAAGKRVRLDQGQILVVALEANSTAGYTWTVAKINPQVLQQAGDMELESESNDADAPILQTIRFQAVHPGRTELLLVHRPPWERGVPIGAFSLDVVVD